MRTAVSRQASVAAWTGSTEDLRLLLDQIKAAFREAEEASTQSLEAKRAGYRAEGHDDETVERLVRFDAGQHERTWIERVSASDRRTHAEHAGRLEEILAALPLRDVERLSLTYPSGGLTAPRSVSIRFRRTAGGIVTVEADEPVWAAAMRDATLEELRRHQPWWSSVFRWWGPPAVYLVLAATLYLALDAALDRAGVKLGKNGSTWALVAIALISSLASNVSLLGRLFPRFEIFQPGGTPTGNKRVGGLITLLAGVILGSFAQFLVG